MYNTFFNYHLNRKQQHQADSIVLFLASASNSTWWRCVGGQILAKCPSTFLLGIYICDMEDWNGHLPSKKSRRQLCESLTTVNRDHWKRSVGGRGWGWVLIRSRDVIKTDTAQLLVGVHECGRTAQPIKTMDQQRKQLTSISNFNFPWCRFIANNAKTQDSKQFNVAFIFFV